MPALLTVPADATTATFDVATTRVAITTDVTISAQSAGVTRTASLRLRIDPTGLRPSANYTIGFAGLTDNRASVPTYIESGFTVSQVSAEWVAITTHGNPLPSLQFMTPGGATMTGEIRITADGAPFWLRSLDLHSSTTRVPYVIEGFLSSEATFTVLNVLGNTHNGSFGRVSNPNADVPVDALLIRLSNPAAPCCANLMGVDNIVLNR